MRLVVLLVLLFCCSSVFALTVQSTSKQIDAFDSYADVIAYEQDGSIHVFFFRESRDVVIASGRNPSIFANFVAFEGVESFDGVDRNDDGDTEDVILQYASINDGVVYNSGVVGFSPQIYSKTIVFTTPESDFGVDVSGDGIIGGHIVRYMSIGGDVILSRIVGQNPVFWKNYVLFQTAESDVGVDLNGDSDLKDVVFRRMSLGDKEAESFRLEGSGAKTDDKGFASLIDSSGNLMLYSMLSGSLVDTNLSVDDHSPFEGGVVWSKNGVIGGFSSRTNSFALTDIKGASPVVSGEWFLFVGSDGLRFGKLDDVDSDGVIDVLDNCIAVSNLVQEDRDSDGFGAACDSDEPLEDFVESAKPLPIEVVDAPGPAREQVVQNIDEANVTIAEPVPSTPQNRWLWLVWALVALVISFPYARRYIARRQKSFGF